MASQEFVAQANLSTRGLVCDLEGGRNPLVLIHGWRNQDDPACGWGDWLDTMRSSPGFLRHYTVWRFRYESSAGLAANGMALAEALRGMSFPSRPVLIGYSMGGLVARVAMLAEDDRGPLAGQVERLITLATPHHGTPLAVPAWWVACDVAARDPLLLESLLEGRKAPFHVRRLLVPCAHAAHLFAQGRFQVGVWDVAWDDWDARLPRWLAARRPYLELLSANGCGEVEGHLRSLGDSFVRALNERQVAAIRQWPQAFEGKYHTCGSTLPSLSLGHILAGSMMRLTSAILARTTALAESGGQALSPGYERSDGIVPIESACPDVSLLPGIRERRWQLAHTDFLRSESLRHHVLTCLRRLVGTRCYPRRGVIPPGLTG